MVQKTNKYNDLENDINLMKKLIKSSKLQPNRISQYIEANLVDSIPKNILKADVPLTLKYIPDIDSFKKDFTKNSLVSESKKCHCSTNKAEKKTIALNSISASWHEYLREREKINQNKFAAKENKIIEQIEKADFKYVAKIGIGEYSFCKCTNTIIPKGTTLSVIKNVNYKDLVQFRVRQFKSVKAKVKASSKYRAQKVAKRVDRIFPKNSLKVQQNGPLKYKDSAQEKYIETGDPNTKMRAKSPLGKMDSAKTKEKRLISTDSKTVSSKGSKVSSKPAEDKTKSQGGSKPDESIQTEDEPPSKGKLIIAKDTYPAEAKTIKIPFDGGSYSKGPKGTATPAEYKQQSQDESQPDKSIKPKGKPPSQGELITEKSTYPVEAKPKPTKKTLAKKDELTPKGVLTISKEELARKGDAEYLPKVISTSSKDEVGPKGESKLVEHALAKKKVDGLLESSLKGETAIVKHELTPKSELIPTKLASLPNEQNKFSSKTMETLAKTELTSKYETKPDKNQPSSKGDSIPAKVKGFSQSKLESGKDDYAGNATPTSAKHISSHQGDLAKSEPLSRSELTSVKDEPVPKATATSANIEPLLKRESKPVKTEPPPKHESTSAKHEQQLNSELTIKNNKFLPKDTPAPVRDKLMDRVESKHVKGEPSPKVQSTYVKNEPAPQVNATFPKNESPSNAKDESSSKSMETLAKNELTSKYETKPDKNQPSSKVESIPAKVKGFSQSKLESGKDDYAGNTTRTSAKHISSHQGELAKSEPLSRSELTSVKDEPVPKATATSANVELLLKRESKPVKTEPPPKHESTSAKPEQQLNNEAKHDKIQPSSKGESIPAKVKRFSQSKLESGKDDYAGNATPTSAKDISSHQGESKPITIEPAPKTHDMSTKDESPLKDESFYVKDEPPTKAENFVNDDLQRKPEPTRINNELQPIEESTYEKYKPEPTKSLAPVTTDKVSAAITASTPATTPPIIISKELSFSTQVRPETERKDPLSENMKSADTASSAAAEQQLLPGLPANKTDIQSITQDQISAEAGLSSPKEVLPQSVPIQIKGPSGQFLPSFGQLEPPGFISAKDLQSLKQIQPPDSQSVHIPITSSSLKVEPSHTQAKYETSIARPEPRMQGAVNSDDQKTNKNINRQRLHWDEFSSATAENIIVKEIPFSTQVRPETGQKDPIPENIDASVTEGQHLLGKKVDLPSATQDQISAEASLPTSKEVLLSSPPMEIKSAEFLPSSEQLQTDLISTQDLKSAINTVEQKTNKHINRQRLHWAKFSSATTKTVEQKTNKHINRQRLHWAKFSSATTKTASSSATTETIIAKEIPFSTQVRLDQKINKHINSQRLHWAKCSSATTKTESSSATTETIIAKEIPFSTQLRAETRQKDPIPDNIESSVAETQQQISTSLLGKKVDLPSETQDQLFAEASLLTSKEVLLSSEPMEIKSAELLPSYEQLQTSDLTSAQDLKPLKQIQPPDLQSMQISEKIEPSVTKYSLQVEPSHTQAKYETAFARAEPRIRGVVNSVDKKTNKNIIMPRLHWAEKRN